MYQASSYSFILSLLRLCSGPSSSFLRANCINLLTPTPGFCFAPTRCILRFVIRVVLGGCCLFLINLQQFFTIIANNLLKDRSLFSTAVCAKPSSGSPAHPGDTPMSSATRQRMSTFSSLPYIISYNIFSPLPPPFVHLCPFVHMACSHLRAFALAVSSAGMFFLQKATNSISCFLYRLTHFNEAFFPTPYVISKPPPAHKHMHYPLFLT